MDQFWGYGPAAWAAFSALGTAGLLLTGAAAAVAALLQRHDMNKAQKEAMRPYVIVTFESSKASRHLIDLVFKNIGQRPAYGVKASVKPALVRTSDRYNPDDEGSLSAQPIFNGDGVPLLPPGQEIRNFFDNAMTRYPREDMPKQFEFGLTYRDSSGKKYSDPFTLNYLGLLGGLFADVKTEHDLAAATEKIAGVLEKSEVLTSGTIDVEAAVEPRPWKTFREERRIKRRVRRFDQAASQAAFVTAVGVTPKYVAPAGDAPRSLPRRIARRMLGR